MTLIISTLESRVECVSMSAPANRPKRAGNVRRKLPRRLRGQQLRDVNLMDRTVKVRRARTKKGAGRPDSPDPAAWRASLWRVHAKFHSPVSLWRVAPRRSGTRHGSSQSDARDRPLFLENSLEVERQQEDRQKGGSFLRWPAPAVGQERAPARHLLNTNLRKDVTNDHTVYVG